MLWDLFGWVGPTGCFLYFFIGAIVNGFLLHRIVPFVYLQERYEGDFRFRHVWNRVHVEQIAFLKGQDRERLRIDRSFEKIVETRREIICRHFPLYLSTNWFDYLGAIVNYAAVGVSILYLNQDRVSFRGVNSSRCLSLLRLTSPLRATGPFIVEDRFADRGGQLQLPVPHQRILCVV